MMPSQKWGTESPDSARTLAAAAAGVRGLTAAMAPAGMPISSAMPIEQRASSRVTGSFDASSSRTGIRLRIDSPKSPCRTLPIQIAYWTVAGSSRWYFFRIAATAAGSCSSPARAIAGSPGSNCCRQNTSTETRKSVGTRAASRRTTKRRSVMREPGPERNWSTRPSGTRSGGQPEALHADDAVRVRREALDLDAESGEHAPVPEVQARHVAQHDLGDLVVELLALGRVGDVSRLHEEGVDLGIAVFAVVLRAVAGDEGVHVAVGVGPAAPEREVRLEVSLVPGLEHRHVFLRLDGHGDSRLREHGLEHESGFLPITLGRHDQREGEIGLTRLLQELTGARDVALAHGQLGVVVGAGRIDPLVAGDVLVVEHRLDERLAIDGEIDGLTQPHVREQLPLRPVGKIQRNHRVAELGNAHDGEAIVGADRGEISGRNALDHLEIAGPEAREARRRVRD